MKLSIIIPVYNAEKHLSRCLDSLLPQGLSPTDYEIILVNDGSTDGSLKIAEAYAAEDSQIKIYSQDNAGIGAARNLGIDKAKGTYLYFIDADDYVVHEVFHLLINRMEIQNLDLCTFNSEVCTNQHLLPTKGTHRFVESEEDVLNGIDYIAKNGFKNEVWWYFIKRDVLNTLNLRFIVGRWIEDSIFTVQLFLNANRIGHENLNIHRHVITAQSAMTSKGDEKYLKVIRDIAYAVTQFKPIINALDANEPGYKTCLKRLKSRQQSFVFFMMVRMLQSSMKLTEIKSILIEMKKVDAYPLNAFLGIDYNKSIYYMLVPIFNRSQLFFLFFLAVNPVFRLKHWLLRSK